jgi:hypothetical protein
VDNSRPAESGNQIPGTPESGKGFDEGLDQMEAFKSQLTSGRWEMTGMPLPMWDRTRINS